MSEHRNPQAKLPKPHTHHNPDTPTLVRDREACTMADLDAIRFEVARVDVSDGDRRPGALRPYDLA